MRNVPLHSDLVSRLLPAWYASSQPAFTSISLSAALTCQLSAQNYALGHDIPAIELFQMTVAVCYGYPLPEECV